jgi:ribose transport system ATP-binding protein
MKPARKRGHSPLTNLLTVTGVTKDYATRVLDCVDFELCSGEIHALVGSNGAGKSTLCKIIAGLIPASDGSMRLSGREYSPGNKHTAEALGVQIVQQELNLVTTLTVAENLMFGRFPHRWGVIHRKRMDAQARTALDRFGLEEIAVDTITAELGVGKQQMLEIAAAIDRQCRVLILDEPTAALTARESERLFERLEQMRDEGAGIIYISHRLDEVTRIADRVTILRDGKAITTRAAESLSTDEMVALMSGKEVNSATRFHHDVSTDRVRLRVHELTREPVVDDVSFQLHEGERLGIAGLVGSGRTELLRLILGADRAESGSLLIDEDDSPHRFTSPSQAVRRGLAMVTEDRKENGLLLTESIRSNITLCDLRRIARCGVTQLTAEQRIADQMRDEMEIRCNDTQQIAGTLSGGNQQKVVVAKWLVRDSNIYLFDEPTRGIDVAARARIYRLFDTLAQQGKSLLIVSSDVDELLETCDRILVLSAGRLVETFSRDRWSRNAIIQASFAGYLNPNSATPQSTA